MYFDNAATTVVSEEVAEIVLKYMRNDYGNAGSIHYAGTQSKAGITEARKLIAKLINADAEDIIFTSCGSESNNMVLNSIRFWKEYFPQKNIVITSSIEHPSVLEPLECLEEEGLLVIRLPVNSNGYIDIKELETYISQYGKGIGLISIMAVNNELGCSQDIRTIGRLCRKNNILFHTDCVQSVETIKIDVEDMCIDFLSMSGHKFHAPKGVGFLYVRNKGSITPLIRGGGQEFSLRSGTENVPGIIGMAEALKKAYETVVSYANVKESFVKRIEELCRSEKIEVYFNGDSKTNQSKIVNLRFPNIDGQTLVLMCSAKNVYVSSGSACKANNNNPSHVLRAIGLTEDEARSSIRVSFSRYNTIQEALAGAEIIVGCVKEMLKDVYR